MNGLLSEQPSAGALRLAVGGYLLLFVQTFLLLLAPDVAGDLRMIVWLVTLVSGAALVGALCGLPCADDFRGRHGR
ncbi:hypothetical protein [Sphingomonas koreensis]